jgi:phosphotriesterase-related protein
MLMSAFSRRQALRYLGLGAVAASVPRASAAPTFPKGAIIRTILRDLPPETLAGGATLFHEHMSLPPDFSARFNAASRAVNGKAGPVPAPLPPGQKFFLQDLDFMTEEMKAARAGGVACLVDGGHEDMGRDLEFLKQLSQKSGMPIVAGTGFYAQPFYQQDALTWSEEQLTRELVRRTNTQPVGVFGEIGSWDEITDTERKVFRAVGKAHVATNLPIFTHTGIPGKSAMEQLDILEKAGVKPDRIVIGHLGNLVDPEIKVHQEICRRGAFVGFDRQGGPGDAQQIPMIVKLIEAGYANRILLSSDFSFANQTKHNGGPGYAKTVTVLGPKLRAAGVGEDVLHGILMDNPRQFLAFVPKKRRN